jgi:hypothetical protein
MSIIVALAILLASLSLGMFIDCIHASKLLIGDGFPINESLVVIGFGVVSAMVFVFSVRALQSWNAGWYVYIGVMVIAAVFAMTLIAGSRSVKSR